MALSAAAIALLSLRRLVWQRGQRGWRGAGGRDESCTTENCKNWLTPKCLLMLEPNGSSLNTSVFSYFLV